MPCLNPELVVESEGAGCPVAVELEPEDPGARAPRVDDHGVAPLHQSEPGENGGPDQDSLIIICPLCVILSVNYYLTPGAKRKTAALPKTARKATAMTVVNPLEGGMGLNDVGAEYRVTHTVS